MNIQCKLKFESIIIPSGVYFVIQMLGVFHAIL